MSQAELYDYEDVAEQESPSTQRDQYTILVPVFDRVEADWHTQIALSLAKGRQGRVVIFGVVYVPEGRSLSEGAALAQLCRRRLDHLRDRLKGESVYIKPRIRAEHEPWRAIAEVVQEENGNMVVIPWHEEGTHTFLGTSIDVLLSLPCHVLVVRGTPATPIRRILLPIRGTSEMPLMLEVALSLARAHNARLTLLHAARAHEDAGSRRLYNELIRLSRRNPWLEQELRVDEEVVPAILDRAGGYDLIIMGAAEAKLGSDMRAVGPIARSVRQGSKVPLIVVKTHRPFSIHVLRSTDGDKRLPATPTSVLVDKWFAENTFSSDEFKDIARLVELKEAQGLTISLGLPALNEEETVGNVIQTVRRALMEEYPLLDEIVLIDSGSTDYTVEIARDLDIPVHLHSDILPQYGTYRGKGEALWKSLYILKGDIVAWIDTDIVNIHPRFVYGILGPLLRNPTIQYVKGFYRRPLKVGDKVQAGGGGRVTELVARPLINLFYPELSGLVQPLAGEYAGRREALERAPFYTGYGVETGLLLDLVERYGISGIAQVDLRQRVHHNQPLTALSRMAFAIIQVFIDHLEQRQRVELLSEINRTMKIIRYGPGRYFLEEVAISDHRRPPIITLPEYRERFNITRWEGPDHLEAFDSPNQEELAS
ncbi:MAG: glucosyl-3-phosphoglycerate synthase [Ardenticatenia bacterium]|nr:glucosyl-3-phosphoglycerate synthase [Ardenticatenia bacterium]